LRCHPVACRVAPTVFAAATKKLKQEACIAPSSAKEEGEMTDLAIATVGIEDKDLTVLKSLLPLVSRLKGLNLQLVDDPAVAQVACLGRLPPERVAELVARHGDHMIMIYCCSRGEEAPPGVRVLGHCPPRANELAEVLVEAAQHATAKRAVAAAAIAAAVPAVLEVFDPARSLAGAIHALLPRLLIDQPLAIKVPAAPCLLLDVNAGVRTAHADPNWFTRPDFWHADPSICELKTTTDSSLLGECRRFPARPYQALRFWGIMCASRGRPVAEVAKAAEVGLKKLPDFKLLPHLDWQPRFAEGMLNKLAPPARLAAEAGRPIGDIYDFLNAANAIGLLKTA
jgi:hypothetical protein